MITTEINGQAYPDDEFILSAEARYYLHEAAKWAKLLAILGFVFCGLIAILLIIAFATSYLMLGFLSKGHTGALNFKDFALLVPMLLILVIYFFFVYYLYQFACKIKKGLTNSDTGLVTVAMNKLKAFFKYWGILTIVMIAIYTFVFIAFLFKFNHWPTTL